MGRQRFLWEEWAPQPGPHPRWHLPLPSPTPGLEAERAFLGRQGGGCEGSGGRPPAPLGSSRWAPLGAGCWPGCWGAADTPRAGSEPCPQPGRPCLGRPAGTRGLSLPRPGGEQGSVSCLHSLGRPAGGVSVGGPGSCSGPGGGALRSLRAAAARPRSGGACRSGSMPCYSTSGHRGSP